MQKKKKRSWDRLIWRKAGVQMFNWKKAEHFNADSESFYRNTQLILGYQKIRHKIIIFYFTLVLKQSVAVKNAPQFVWDQPDSESASLQIEEIVLYGSADKTD